jgi:hypothetical protein
MARITTQRVASLPITTLRGPKRSATTPPPSINAALGTDPTAIAEHGFYGLLVLDGGGQGKGDGLPADAWLTHPALRTLEIPPAPDLTVLVATLGRRDRTEPGRPRGGHRTG